MPSVSLIDLWFAELLVVLSAKLFFLFALLVGLFMGFVVHSSTSFPTR
jgi:hypothetical protein